MRQIFIVHSSVDDRFEVFFSRIFMTASVGTVWETYQTAVEKPAMREKVLKEIAASDALFLVLSTDSEFASRAKAWFPWAVESAKGKDIWVFEHCEDLKRVQPLVAGLTHYAAFYITNAWSDHVAKALEIYEKSGTTKTPLPAALLKPLDPREADFFFRPQSGLALFNNSTDQPAGMSAVCPSCSAAYELHAPSAMKVIRCPACGRFNGLLAPPKGPTRR